MNIRKFASNFVIHQEQREKCTAKLLSSWTRLLYKRNNINIDAYPSPVACNGTTTEYKYTTRIFTNLHYCYQ